MPGVMSTRPSFSIEKCYIGGMVRSKMTKSQKEINDVMVQVLEQVIFPRFDQLDEKIDGVRTELKAEIREVNEKVEVLDEKVDYTNRRLDVLVDEFKDHDKRITKLEVRAGFVVN